MIYLFSKFFYLPLTGTFKNCTITNPLSHNNRHILRWYEWDLLVFCNKRRSSWPLLRLKALRYSPCITPEKIDQRFLVS